MTTSLGIAFYNPQGQRPSWSIAIYQNGNYDGEEVKTFAKNAYNQLIQVREKLNRDPSFIGVVHLATVNASEQGLAGLISNTDRRPLNVLPANWNSSAWCLRVLHVLSQGIPNFPLTSNTIQSIPFSITNGNHQQRLLMLKHNNSNRTPVVSLA
ncbi:hypothetical protein NLJ89_g12023 [Agrocybe chaxingu]|uniref:Uncharacterized protein n=1 Tax=Agrocybe chaxingu TaxID=84603 RepID=A0A9W8JVN1_9AGAR|nr:hypothetical protein NLJ89_g12023 [Agrocybe chaxingu]